METENPYLFHHEWEGEADRLAGIQAIFDPGTQWHLDRLGVEEGWRCWEVGAGAGSIARWLCDRVGPRGRVVASDISTKLIDEAFADDDAKPLEILQHCVLTEDPPEGPFDLIHSRLVLEHLPGREEALRRMASALAPGGWLVVEDMDWRPAGSVSRFPTPMDAFLRAAGLVMKGAGYDKTFGRRLPVLFSGLGLTEVAAEGRAIFLVGASPQVSWFRPTVERFRLLLTEKPRLERYPVLRRLAGGSIDRVEALLEDPKFAFVAPALVTACGRRPFD